MDGAFVIPGTNIRVLSDEELLAFFKGRPVGLVGPPENQRLVLFGDAVDVHDHPQPEGMGVAEQPSFIPLMGDKEGYHPDPDNKVNILYADGHASKNLTFAQKR